MTATVDSLPRAVQLPLSAAAIGIVVFALIFGVWAIMAPLATTLTFQGTIVSSRPSLALQHPYGGLVGHVFVETHDTVEQGEALLRFDTVREEETLRAQLSIRDRLLAENATISALLTQDGAPVRDAESPLIVRRKQVDVQESSVQEAIALLEQQIATLETKISYSEAQLSLMTARADRLTHLGDQGLTRLSDQEQLQERVLIVKGEISSDRAAIADLQNQIARMQQQLDMAEIALEHELKSLLQQNMERLDQLQSTIIELSDRIEKSTVRAPIAGTVASVPVEAEHMFATPGATLMTLTRPIEEAQVSFSIPVDQIDQVRPGMYARLVVPSIPQRKMPRLDIQIEAISPRANHDENGNPTSFSGLATANADVFKELEQSMRSDALLEDMPVVLTVAAGETTFAEYFFAPFASAFSKALQD